MQSSMRLDARDDTLPGGHLAQVWKLSAPMTAEYVCSGQASQTPAYMKLPAEHLQSNTEVAASKLLMDDFGQAAHEAIEADR